MNTDSSRVNSNSTESNGNPPASEKQPATTTTDKAADTKSPDLSSKPKDPEPDKAASNKRRSEGSGSNASRESGKGSEKTSVPEMAEASGKEGISAGDTIIEITGKDIDGEKFSLSDYSGKVVLLDFWGDW